MQHYSIGDVARESGVAVSAIRYYEDQGLLPKPHRLANNRRCYGNEAIQAVKFIAACRKASMTLVSIRRLQDQLRQEGQPCQQAGEIVGDAVSDITRQIVDLQKARKQLSKVAAACSPALCGKGCSVSQSMLQAW